MRHVKIVVSLALMAWLMAASVITLAQDAASKPTSQPASAASQPASSLTTRSATGTISGSVVTENGDIAADAQVMVFNFSDTSKDELVAVVTAGKDGKFQCEVPAGKGYRIVASAKITKGGSVGRITKITVVAGKTTDVGSIRIAALPA